MGSKESGRRKYSAEVHAKLVQALEVGAFKKHAADAAGISIEVLTSWLEQGAQGKAPYDKLLEEVNAAIARDAIRNQAAISKAASGVFAGDWKAAAWNLVKKHPKLYGNSEPVFTARGERVFSPWKDPELP